MRGVKRFATVSILFLCTVLVALGHTAAYARDMLYPGEELRRGDNLTSADGRYKLILQRDGNLVLYGPRNLALWSTNTQGRPVERCIMQPDGNLVLYLPGNQSVWYSNTQSYPGSFLWLRNDGNLVIYHPLWSTGTPQQRREDYHDRKDEDRDGDRWRR